MRLINVDTYHLEYYIGRPTPPYAILSHTWEDEEVLFQNMQDGHLDKARKKKGFAKIEHCCRQAREDGFDWAWVDTCCIDKSSSAELSETINSMYAYYEKSHICYAYLNDVEANEAETYMAQTGLDRLIDRLRQSRWFTRGWTLQEFIAPFNVVFYSKEWSFLTSKSDWRRRQNLLPPTIALIPADILLKAKPLFEVPALLRMHWAADRRTTRVEDLAYSLMGIFGVNMPLLYGEGSKSFIRLQEEILESTEDFSLLAWHGGPFPEKSRLHGWMQGPDYDCFGVLPTSPSFFRNHCFSTCKLRGNSKLPSLPAVAGNTIPMTVYFRSLTGVVNTPKIWDNAGDIVQAFGTRAFRLFLVALPGLSVNITPKKHANADCIPVILSYDPSDDGPQSAFGMVRMFEYIAEWPAELVDASKGWMMTTCHFRRSGHMLLRPSSHPDMSSLRTTGPKLVWKGEPLQVLKWRKSSPHWSIAHASLREDVTNKVDYLVFRLERTMAASESASPYRSRPIICCLAKEGISVGALSLDARWDSDRHGEMTDTAGEWLSEEAHRSMMGQARPVLTGDGPIAEMELLFDGDIDIGEKLVVRAIATKLDTSVFETSTSAVHLWLSILKA